MSDLRRRYLGARSAHLVVCSLVLAAGCRAAAAPLPPAVSPPDEVNIGYGSQKRQNVTGSVSSLTADELGKPRSATMERVLRGRIPGLQVVRQPGGEISLWIRGLGSPRERTGPHVVIDGVNATTVDLLALDPQVVERIDVLKDAAAAVYGFRGANGVILVRTKRSL